MKLSKMLGRPAVAQGALVIGDQGLLSLTTFLTGALLARSTTADEYGFYVLGLSILTLAQSFQYALTNLPITIRLPRSSEDDRIGIIGSALLFTVLMGLAFTSIPLAMQILQTWTAEPPQAYSALLIPLAVATLPYITRYHLRGSLLALLKVKASLAVSIIGSTLHLAALFILFTSDNLDLTSAFYLITGANIFVSACILLSREYRISIRPERIREDIRENWRLGKWLLVNVFGFFGSSQVYPWLILLFIDAGAVAAFGACLATASLLSPLLNGLSAFVLPKMSHGIKDGNRATLLRMLRQSMLGLSALYGVWLLVGLLWGENILRLFFGDAYSVHTQLFALLLLKTVIESVGSPLTSALQAIEKPAIVTISLFTSSIVTLGIGSLIIPELGLIAAGWTTVAAAMTSFLIRWQLLRRAL